MSKSTLAKTPHCWKSHAAAHIVVGTIMPWAGLQVLPAVQKIKRKIFKKILACVLIYCFILS